MKSENHYCVKRNSECKAQCYVDVTPLDEIVLCESNPHLACVGEK